MPNDKHVIILPYFCQDEIRRYLRIAEWLKECPLPKCDFHFLLASSPKIVPSRELEKTYSKIGPCTSFACPTQIFGYPEGPTAMYWDSMEFAAQNFSGSKGFCLWLESDMAPVKADWLDRLSDEWFAGSPPLMMGCHVPDIYKKRLFRRPKLLLDAHINGGACYAMDFARRLPAEARRGVFDMSVYRHAVRENGVRKTDQIAFSTVKRARRDVLCPDKALLHGFMQEKDKFVDACLRPITKREQRASVWHPVQDRLETLQRRVRVQFVRRGHQAMLENMLLTKQDADAAREVA